MAAVRRALKQRADRTASCIERHNDVGRPIRTLIGVTDGISALSEGACMTFELIHGALGGLLQGKAVALRYIQQECQLGSGRSRCVTSLTRTSQPYAYVPIAKLLSVIHVVLLSIIWSKNSAAPRAIKPFA